MMINQPRLNKMKLEHVINWCIYNYPTLYRDKTLAESRLKVLGQLFLTNGNGYEWHKDGFLVDGNQSNCRKTLPKGFFDKNLYSISVPPQLIPLAKEQMGSRFYYRTKSKMGREVDFIFEAKSDNEALPLYKILGKNGMHIYEARSNYPFHPYPLCEYAGLVEILNGKTNSLRQDNFALIPQEDWLHGCVEVATRALSYFYDSQCSTDMHHPSRTIPDMNRDVQRGKDSYWRENMKKSETVEQYAWRLWNEHFAHQTGLLKQFLVKFKV